MADNNGKLVFPIRFDFESTLREASKDADRVLRRLEASINSQPLKIDFQPVLGKGMKDIQQSFMLDPEGNKIFEGSLKAIRAEMNQLIKAWDELTEKNRITNQQSGEYTTQAKVILQRYSELVAASESYAKSLGKIATEAKKAEETDAKRFQKTVEELQRFKQAFHFSAKDSSSLADLGMNLKILQDRLRSLKPNTTAYDLVKEKIREIGEAYDKLLTKNKLDTSNRGRLDAQLEQYRLQIKSTAQNADECKIQIEALNALMSQETVGSEEWNQLASKMSEVRDIQQRINTQTKEATKSELELANAQKARQNQQLQKEWNASADAHRREEVEKERRILSENARIKREAEDTAKREAEIIRKVNEYKLQRLQAEQEAKRFSDEEYANLKKQLEEENRAAIAKAKAAKEERQNAIKAEEEARKTAELEKQKAARQAIIDRARQESEILRGEESTLSQINAKISIRERQLSKAKPGTMNYGRILADLMRLRDLQEEVSKIQVGADSWRLYQKAISNTEKTLEALQTKLNAFQTQASKTDYTSQTWNTLNLRIRETREELEQINQKMADFQQKAFQGLSNNMTKQQVEKLTQLRRAVESYDKSINREYQAGRGYNANGEFTDTMKAMLESRMNLTREINKMLKTGYDLQLEREKEINKIQEQRKAKAEAIAAKKKAEIQATQASIAKQKEERRILNQQESTVKAIADKLAIMQKRLQTTNMKSGEFEKVAKEVERLTKKLEEAHRKIDNLTGKTTTGADQRQAAVRRVSNEFARRGNIRVASDKETCDLCKFLTSHGLSFQGARCYTQFELQRVSLGAIIQDQTKANALFSEIKQFAIKSPISIMDLTKYTKQVAAYRVEYDKLFDTTKRLADVSVGLGVDMGRITLAYGQVKAASYLRAAEVRQFTEAGIPMLELVAEKLSKMNGELVTTEQAMDAISKRGVEFSVVEEIFNDMTSAGGMFYNMQEKQGNTLFGMWAKLGDAASIMYEEIGNTGPVNDGMKELINASANLMRNWKAASLALTPLIGLTSVLLLVRNAERIGDKKKAAIDAKVKRTTEMRTAAQSRLNQALATGTSVEQSKARAALITAENEHKAALAEQRRLANAKSSALGWKSMGKSLLSGLGVGIALSAVTALAYELLSASYEADRLKNKISEIDAETPNLQGQSERNFIRMAEAALKAADGSKQQEAALADLQRVYKDMLPEESLKIENLRAMKHNYEGCTIAIREFIEEQQRQKKINETQEYYNNKIVGEPRGMREIFINNGAEEEDFQKFLESLTRQIQIEGQNWKTSVRKAMEEAFKVKVGDLQFSTSPMEAIFDKLLSTPESITESIKKLFGFEFQTDITTFINATNDLTSALERLDAETAKAGPELGEFGEVWSNMTKQWKENPIAGDSFADIQQRLEYDLTSLVVGISTAMDGMGLAWQDGWANLQTIVEQSDLTNLTEIQFSKILEYINKQIEIYSQLSDTESQQYLARLQQLRLFVEKSNKQYNQLRPTDATVVETRRRFYQLGTTVVAWSDTYQRHLMKQGQNTKAYKDYLKGQLDSPNDNLKQYVYTRNLPISFGRPVSDMDNKIKSTEEEMKLLQAMYDELPDFDMVKDKSKKTEKKEDPWIFALKNRSKFMQDFQRQVEDLSKTIGKTKALLFEQDNMKGRGLSMKIDTSTLDGSREGLIKWYEDSIEEIRTKIAKLGGKEWNGLGVQLLMAKDTKSWQIKQYREMLQQMWGELTKFRTDKLQADIDKQINELADRISRTKTAKEFYEKILSHIGDVELALRLSLDVYGENGKDLNKQIREQIESLVKPTSATWVDTIFNSDGTLNAKQLREFAETEKDLLGDSYKELIKIADNADKDFAKTVENWLKSIEKAKSYSDKMLDLSNKTKASITEINRRETNGDLNKTDADILRTGLRKKQAEEEASLMYGAFKDTPMYVQMFDDLDNASTRMLENMKSRIEGMRDNWKDLSPTQLKELQSRLNEIDKQLAQRNPFSELAKGIGKYREYMKNGDSRGNRSEKAAGQDLINTAKAADEARQKYEEILHKDGATKEEIAQVKTELDAAMSNEEAAQKAVEAWKKVKDTIGLSADELFKMLNWAGDIAQGIADMSEAMGVDEEDVQYWNDIASALGDIGVGIQDIVQNALSGNVIGIVSSALTAIPKMIIGFGNLFYAGRIKRANKEIKRQQELLDQLEYTYGRVEKAADKLFGTDFISNYNQQMKLLQAEQTAYLKQAEAERSKGKKADKDKIKEYEEAARDAADAIKDMEGELTSHFLGSDRTSLAREFAEAWVEAKTTFTNTADAIKSKYKDMIQSMVIEGAAAKIIDNLLAPMWKQMDSLLAKSDVSGAIDYLINGMDDFIQQADNGMNVLWESLKVKGYDMTKLLGESDTEATGIAREFATASEEDINGLAQMYNTNNFYVSQICENVLVMRRLMEGDVSIAGTGIDPTPLIQQSLENQATMLRYQAETVAECRNIAARCQDQLDIMRRVVGNKGNAQGVRVIM